MSTASVNKAAAAAVPAIAPLLGNIVVAVGGAVTAWSTLSTRFQRVQRFDTDTGGGEMSFRIFYLVPQYLNALLFIALILIASIATLGGLMTSAAPGIHISGSESWVGRVAVGFYELGWWVVILGAAAGGIAVMDLIARVELLAGRVISWLPIAGIEERYGVDGRSLGWLQAKELVRAGGSALPLAIDHDGIDRVAEATLTYVMATGLAGRYRAAPPHGTPSGKGNIALFACIIEQVEYDLQKPTRDWDKLYEVLGDLNQSTNLFEPAQLVAVTDGKAFHATLKAGLDPILAAFNPAQPEIPGGSVARDFVAAAFDRLKAKFDGDAIQMAFRQPIGFSSHATGLRARARHFPKLNDDKMGPQFVKLCLRFGAIDVSDKDALIPAFSSSIGWFLLNNDALTALQEVKSLTFRGPMNRPAVRIAEKRVIKIVADEIEASIAAYPNVAAAVASLSAAATRWYIEQEADTAVWSTAQHALGAARAANWVGCRWKLDDLTATRV